LKKKKNFHSFIFFILEKHQHQNRTSMVYGLENSPLSLNCIGSEDLSYFMFAWILNNNQIIKDEDDGYCTCFNKGT
jgi:hypothetical protein